MTIKQYKLDKVNIVMPLGPVQDTIVFAKQYAAGNKGDYKDGGPTELDERNQDKFYKLYDIEYVRNGYAGSGITRYINKNTGEKFLVTREANGKGFHGTNHYVSIDDLNESTSRGIPQNTYSNQMATAHDNIYPRQQQLPDKLRLRILIDEYNAIMAGMSNKDELIIGAEIEELSTKLGIDMSDMFESTQKLKESIFVVTGTDSSNKKVSRKFQNIKAAERWVKNSKLTNSAIKQDMVMQKGKAIKYGVFATGADKPTSTFNNRKEAETAMTTLRKKNAKKYKVEIIKEAVEKIACIDCDAVSTKKAWAKNNGTCPKCKTSTQGVAESADYNEPSRETHIAALRKLRNLKKSLRKAIARTDLEQTKKLQLEIDKLQNDIDMHGSVSESDIQDDYEYGVFSKGGSIGNEPEHLRKPVKIFDDPEEAKEYAKRMRKMLTPGEKKHYGLGYVTKKFKKGKYEITERFLTPNEIKANVSNMDDDEVRALAKDPQGIEGRIAKFEIKRRGLTEGVLDSNDEDGVVIKRKLYDIAKHAAELHKLIADTDGIEPWIQSKITTAADYINTVAHYMEYNEHNSETSTFDITDPDVGFDVDLEEDGYAGGGTEITSNDIMRMAGYRNLITDEQLFDEDLEAVASDVAAYYSPVEEMGSSDVSAMMHMFADYATEQGITLTGQRAALYGSKAYVRENTSTEARKIFEKMITPLRK